MAGIGNAYSVHGCSTAGINKRQQSLYLLSPEYQPRRMAVAGISYHQFKDGGTSFPMHVNDTYDIKSVLEPG
ncbi:hypothetical protein MMC32_007703 [Xylographa parallela]|nr:hypothetical protein [Xylographa parallela]